MIAGLLADKGVLVCSGAAIGVDAAAHWAALDRGQPTAIFSPVSCREAYPKSHQKLFQRVSNHGLIVTSIAPETALHISHFRQRNRLLTQAVDALIVICADRRSGSLQCARQAWRLGIPVMACPWSDGEINSVGTLHLLQSGARAISPNEDAINALIDCLQVDDGSKLLSRDLLLSPLQTRRRKLPLCSALSTRTIDGTHFGWQRYATAGSSQESSILVIDELKLGPNERMLWSRIRDSDLGVSTEELIECCNLPRSEVTQQLLQWVLQGLVHRDVYGRFVVSTTLSTK